MHTPHSHLLTLLFCIHFCKLILPCNHTRTHSFIITLTQWPTLLYQLAHLATFTVPDTPFHFLSLNSPHLHSYSRLTHPNTYTPLHTQCSNSTTHILACTYTLLHSPSAHIPSLAHSTTLTHIPTMHTHPFTSPCSHTLPHIHTNQTPKHTLALSPHCCIHFPSLNSLTGWLGVSIMRPSGVQC